jgi:hypothetical protein
MDVLIGMLDLLTFAHLPRRTVYYVLGTVIVLGLAAVAANLLEPARASF